jgi:hypothetical protein
MSDAKRISGDLTSYLGRRALLAALAALVLVGAPPRAGAQVCQAGSSPQAALQYLRRLSIDLRGRLPTLDELDSVATNGAVDPSLIESMLQSEEFIAQSRAYHRNLLWTNVTAQRLSNQAWALYGPRPTPPAGVTDPPFYYFHGGRSHTYRGGGSTNDVACLDQPATFDATGAIQTTPDPNDATIQREGWVMVTPYWSPQTQIKVCAFDAQANLQATDSSGRTVDCSRSTVKGCGCGPNLEWCQSAYDGTELTIKNAFDEQLLRFTDGIVRNDRPYTDVLLAKDMEVNGPIAFYFRHQTNDGQNFLLTGPEQNYGLPDLPFDQADSWMEVQRGQGHAGLLTMPAYLIKFQSNRGRTNRFFNAFLCQFFQAPPGGLPPADDACQQELDLTKRCGCKYCHQIVEPNAAYWGRWAEAGVMPLNETAPNAGDPAFPSFRMSCADPNTKDPVCKRLYYTTPFGPEDMPYAGMLLPYVFADDVRKANIATGPIGIAQSAVDNGNFAACTVKHLWTQYMGRDVIDAEQPGLDALSTQFQQGYSFRGLVRRIVTSPEYVQAGNYVAAATAQ